MADVASKIQTYHLLFVVCLILAIVCAIAAVTLFFVLKINEVFGYLTGSKAKRQILALEESSAASGRLMSRRNSNMHQMAQGIKDDMGVIDVASPGARVVENAVKNDANSSAYQGVENTSLLGQGQDGGVENTSLLGQNADTTNQATYGVNEVPRADEGSPGVEQATNSVPAVEVAESMQGSDHYTADGETGTLSGDNARVGTFVIEKEIILLHAEDVI